MKTQIFYRILGMFKNIGADWDKLAPTKETAIHFADSNINPEPIRKIDTSSSNKKRSHL